MGVVYETYDEKLGRRIALKCARAGRGQHLSPEVRLATEVSHPNICKIYEIHTAETGEGPLDFFTMEFLEGRTLSQRLKEGPPPRDEALAIARQLCAGLAEAHRHGIIHGDLKPVNVFLTKDPGGALRTVITDFGLSRAAWTAVGTAAHNSPGGTLAYMAPELFQGSPTTVASDIYALGVILYELVCGLRPQERAVALASTVTIAAGEPAVASTREQRIDLPSQAKLPPLNSRWDAVLDKCLQPDPRQRYESAEQVLSALGPSKLRRRALIIGGALSLAAVAALATYRGATAPPRSARLDIAVESPPALAAQAQELRRETLREIERLKSSGQLAFSVQSSQPTHRLSSSLVTAAGKFTLHALLRDVRSGAPISEWSADFTPAQLRYAPVALAGIVGSALHLPPLTTGATVNAKAAAPYQQGLALFQDDRRLDQAIAAFQSAAVLDPDSALPYAGIAEAQRRRFFLTKVKSWDDQATASLMQAEIRNPDCAEVHRIAGLLEFDANRPEQAIARMRRAAEFQPPHPDAFRRLGQLYYQAGQFPEALQALSEARRLAPKDVRIYQDLANVYNAQSDFAQASDVLRQAVALAPDRPLLRTVLAATLQDQGRFSEAETELRSALKQENSTNALVQLAHVLMYQGKDEDALPLLSKAVTLDARRELAWLYLGLASRRQGRDADARNAFRRGLAVAEEDVIQTPRNGRFHAVLAYFCAQTGQAARARVESAQALQLAPHDYDTIWWRYSRTSASAIALAPSKP